MLQIILSNPYLGVTDSEQYYTDPIDMDIMKYLISKGHYCSLSGGLYPVQGGNDCALALYFITIRTHFLYYN